MVNFSLKMGIARATANAILVGEKLSEKVVRLLRLVYIIVAALI